MYQGITPGDNPTQAADIVGPFSEAGVTCWLEPIAPYVYGRDFDEPWDFERLHERVLQGPPEL